ncbi:MAG: carboxypeptidase-like regulatory domain-containing protein [Vicinamibacterales bacterium]
MAPAFLVCALVLAQAVAPGMPQRPGGSAPSDPAGTAVIRGTVTAADTGRPLRRARVTLTGQPLSAARATSTNIRGEYELKDLPAGRYVLRVQRGGYLPMQYGQRRPGEAAQPLDLADGQALGKLDMALPRAGIISGRVVDETGEAVSGVRVWPMRQEYFRGRRRLVPAGSDGTTDDTGQYRILNVPPGEYYLMALLRETWTAGPERQTFGYAPTYFPGMARVADASRVKVGIAQEAANIDFALVAQRASVVSGIATGADGTPLAGARVSLSLEIMGPGVGMSMSAGGATVAADGSWRMRGVAPGEYQLAVSSQERDRPPARASMTLFVQGADIEGLSLVADTGGTVTGQIVTDTGEALPTPPVRMRVVAEPIGPDQRPYGIMVGDENGVATTDGRFTLTGALGRSVLRLQGLPRGWVVKSIDAGDRDLAESPLEVRGGETVDARIVITNRFPIVSGRVVDEKANPSAGSVLLFPTDAAMWFDPGVLRLTRPDQTGLFRFENVRPGDYLAVALEVLESWQASDPEFLEGLRSSATSVTVREGQPLQLSLTVR